MWAGIKTIYKPGVWEARGFDYIVGERCGPWKTMKTPWRAKSNDYPLF